MGRVWQNVAIGFVEGEELETRQRSVLLSVCGACLWAVRVPACHGHTVNRYNPA